MPLATTSKVSFSDLNTDQLLMSLHDAVVNYPISHYVDGSSDADGWLLMSSHFETIDDLVGDLMFGNYLVRMGDKSQHPLTDHIAPELDIAIPLHDLSIVRDHDYFMSSNVGIAGVRNRLDNFSSWHDLKNNWSDDSEAMYVQKRQVGIMVDILKDPVILQEGLQLLPKLTHASHFEMDDETMLSREAPLLLQLLQQNMQSFGATSMWVLSPTTFLKTLSKMTLVRELLK